MDSIIRIILALINSIINLNKQEENYILPANGLGLIEPVLMANHRNIKLLVKTGNGWISRSLDDLWAYIGNETTIAKSTPMTWRDYAVLAMIFIAVLMILFPNETNNQGGLMIGAVAMGVKEWIVSLINGGKAHKATEKTSFASFNVEAIQVEDINPRTGKPMMVTVGIEVVRYFACDCGKSYRILDKVDSTVTCTCGKEAKGTMTEFPPMMLNTWALDRGISLDNFAVMEIDGNAKRWLAKENKVIETGNWLSFGKVHTAGSSQTWMFKRAIGKALVETFGDIGSLGGYGQLLTSALYRGIHRIADAKIMYVEAGIHKDSDGSCPCSVKLAKKLGVDKNFQFRLLGKKNGKELIAKGTFILTEDETLLRGADLIIDVNQVKVGKGLLKEGDFVDDGILGVSNIDGEGDSEGYLSWQVTQWLPNTKEVNSILSLNMKVQVQKLIEELSIMWTDKQAYAKILKRLAYKVYTDDGGKISDSVLEDQDFIFKMLVSNLPNIASRAARAKIVGHIFTLEVTKMSLGCGIPLETHMLKFAEKIDPATATFGIRYPFLTGQSAVMCSPQGHVCAKEAKFGQADYDGDTIAVFNIQTELDRKIADIVIASLMDRSKAALDISPLWEMRADNRQITVTNIRTKLLEQLQCMEIGVPTNVLQVALAMGDLTTARCAAICAHESAQVLKKYPVLKETKERVQGDKQWWFTAFMTYEKMKYYGLDKGFMDPRFKCFNVARIWKNEMTDRLRKGMLKPRMLETALVNPMKTSKIMDYATAHDKAVELGFKNLGFLAMRWKRNLEIASSMWNKTEMGTEWNVFSKMEAILGSYKTAMNKLTTNVHATPLSILKEIRKSIVDLLGTEKYQQYLTEDKHPMTPTEYITVHEILNIFAKEMTASRGTKEEKLSEEQKHVARKAVIEKWKAMEKSAWDEYTTTLNAALKRTDSTEDMWKRVMIYSLFQDSKLGQICLPKGTTPMDIFGWNPVLEQMIPDADEKHDRRLTPEEEKFNAQIEEDRIIELLRNSEKVG